MKQKMLATALCISLLTLTACSTTSTDPNTGETGRTTLFEQAITLHDGRVVTCVARTGGYKGGLSCDWNNAK